MKDIRFRPGKAGIAEKPVTIKVPAQLTNNLNLINQETKTFLSENDCPE